MIFNVQIGVRGNMTATCSKDNTTVVGERMINYTLNYTLPILQS